MNEDFIKTLEVCGIKVDLYLDDFGQSYYIKFTKNGEDFEIGLGTYNTNYIESIFYELDPTYKKLVKKELFGDFSEDDAKLMESYRKKFDKIYNDKI